MVKIFPTDERFIMVKHLKENARGIPANIAEGFYRFHYQDSIRFYLIARGCLGELKNDLYMGFDQKFINQNKFTEVNDRVEKILIMLNGLIKSTRLQINNNSNSK